MTRSTVLVADDSARHHALIETEMSAVSTNLAKHIAPEMTNGLRAYSHTPFFFLTQLFKKIRSTISRELLVFFVLLWTIYKYENVFILMTSCTYVDWQHVFSMNEVRYNSKYLGFFLTHSNIVFGVICGALAGNFRICHKCKEQTSTFPKEQHR